MTTSQEQPTSLQTHTHTCTQEAGKSAQLRSRRQKRRANVLTVARESKRQTPPWPKARSRRSPELCCTGHATVQTTTIREGTSVRQKKVHFVRLPVCMYMCAYASTLVPPRSPVTPRCRSRTKERRAKRCRQDREDEARSFTHVSPTVCLDVRLLEPHHR